MSQSKYSTYNMKNFKKLKEVENIEDLYTFSKELGRGQYGCVKLGKRNQTDK